MKSIEYFPEPTWVAEARSNYTRSGERISSETHANRGSQENQVLDRYVLHRRLINKVNILLVGAGMDNDDVQCPIQPYRIAAYLESRKLDYRMVIVDIDQEILSDIRSRTKIFMFSDYEGRALQTQASEEAWAEYLDHTGQVQEKIYKPHPELKLDIFSSSSGNAAYVRSKYRNGFSIADIPRTFKEKLEKREIALVHGDIATVDLLSHRAFDFVSCMNVLYLLPEAGQKLALFNMARSLREDGVMLINNSPFKKRLFPDSRGNGWFPDGMGNGWFDREKQEDLRLRLLEGPPISDRFERALLEKVRFPLPNSGTFPNATS